MTKIIILAKVQSMAFALLGFAVAARVFAPASSLASSQAQTPRVHGEMAPCPEGPFSFKAVRTRSTIVSSVDTQEKIIHGEDESTNEPVSVTVCDRAIVSGSNGLEDIRSGDVVTAKEVHDFEDRPIAIELVVNLFVAIAVLGPENGNRIAISVRNDQTLRPVTTLYPRLLGIVPKWATVDSSTQIAGDCRVNKNTLAVGKVVKLYGYKPPSSSTVRLFRIEFLQNARLKR